MKVTREMFRAAEREEIETGLMDHKGDFRLNRFVRVRAMDPEDAQEASNMEKAIAWPVAPLEGVLYGHMGTFLAAYATSQGFFPAEGLIDLEKISDNEVVPLRLGHAS